MRPHLHLFLSFSPHLHNLDKLYIMYLLWMPFKNCIVCSSLLFYPGLPPFNVSETSFKVVYASQIFSPCVYITLYKCLHLCFVLYKMTSSKAALVMSSWSIIHSSEWWIQLSKSRGIILRYSLNLTLLAQQYAMDFPPGDGTELLTLFNDFVMAWGQEPSHPQFLFSTCTVAGHVPSISCSLHNGPQHSLRHIEVPILWIWPMTEWGLLQKWF